MTFNVKEAARQSVRDRLKTLADSHFDRITARSPSGLGYLYVKESRETDAEILCLYLDLIVQLSPSEFYYAQGIRLRLQEMGIRAREPSPFRG